MWSDPSFVSGGQGSRLGAHAPGTPSSAPGRRLGRDEGSYRARIRRSPQCAQTVDNCGEPPEPMWVRGPGLWNRRRRLVGVPPSPQAIPHPSHNFQTCSSRSMTGTPGVVHRFHSG